MHGKGVDSGSKFGAQRFVGIGGQAFGDGQAARGTGVGVFKPDFRFGLHGQRDAAVRGSPGDIHPIALRVHCAYHRTFVAGRRTPGGLGHSVGVGLAAAVRQGQFQRVAQFLGVEVVGFHLGSVKLCGGLRLRIYHDKM